MSVPKGLDAPGWDAAKVGGWGAISWGKRPAKRQMSVCMRLLHVYDAGKQDRASNRLLEGFLGVPAQSES